MACAHAKISGDVGVCLATSGPGRDPPPQRALRRQARPPAGRGDRRPAERACRSASSYQQEVDLDSLFKDVASEYVQVAMVPAQVTHLIDRAVQIAPRDALGDLRDRPADLQEQPSRSRRARTAPSSRGGPLHEPRVRPAARPTCVRAAEVLNAGERVAILIGQGARGGGGRGRGGRRAPRRRRRQGAERPRRAARRPALRHRLDRPARDEAERRDDAGLRHAADDRLRLPVLGVAARAGPGARRADRHRRASCSASATRWRSTSSATPRTRCGRCCRCCERKADRSWRDEIDGRDRPLVAHPRRPAEIDAEPLNPLKVFHELSPRLPDDCIVTADSGSGTNWWARHLRFRRGMRGALSGTLASMGPALPYALAAKFVHPDRPVIAIEGDGAMQMNGINALIDVAKYRDRWTDPRFIVLVLNNHDLNQVTWEQRVLAGDPKLPASQVAPRLPVRRATPSCSGFGASASTRPSRSPALGARRWPPTAPVLSRRSSIPRSRRCRRTSSSSRPRTWRRRWPRATRAGPDHPPVAEGEGAGAAQPLRHAVRVDGPRGGRCPA